MHSLLQRFGASVAVAVTTAALVACGKTSVSCEDLATCPGGAGGSDEAGMSDRNQETGGADGGGGTRNGDASSDAIALPDVASPDSEGGDSRADTPSSDVVTDAGSETGPPSDATVAGGGDASADADAPCGDVDPAVDSCIVDDAFGVFVSPAGDDRNAGTKAAPFRTIGVALVRAAARGGRAFVCGGAGVYAESLSIDATLDGLALYGGFDCTTWAYSTALRVVVRPTTAAVALMVRNVTSLRVHDIEFDAASAPGPGTSSVAAFVATSTGVELVRVRLAAGNGTAGQAGTGVPDSATLNGSSGGSGNNACERPLAGAQGMGTCGSEQTLGGIGGLGGGVSGGPGGTGGLGMSSPAVTAPLGLGGFGEGQVAGGPPWQCGSVETGGGQVGGLGAEGAAGTGATTSGLLDTNGWQTTRGTDGLDGHVGQGGGGGGGAAAPGACPLLDTGLPTGAAGGSGGAGGCGGRAGGGGTSGGSSIALLGLSSNLSLTMTEIVTGAAGRGGDGGRGQQGGLGGPGGVGSQGSGSNASCPGGGGGRGGRGGSGGGGAGGSSIGILTQGGRVTQVSTSFQIGLAGDAGRDGNGLSTGSGAGARGQSVEQMML